MYNVYANIIIKLSCRESAILNMFTVHFGMYKDIGT